ncbi:MAG: hypothetical protein MZV49_15870 [Rhodopseudomonas palustris]|nr:hypothetical protein [Rhodopseudomonas palustris]
MRRTDHRRAAAALIATLALGVGPQLAAGCELPRLGEGRVAAIIDANSIRLADGSELTLAGLARYRRRASPTKPRLVNGCSAAR